MVQSQKFIVNIDGFIVRFPLPNQSKVSQAQNQNQLKGKLEVLNKNRQNHCQLQNEIKNEVDQNIKRVKIGSIWIVFIMLKFFDQRRRSHVFLLFCHS